MGDSFTFSMEMSSIFRCAYGFFERVLPVLDRDLPADVLGRAAAVDVRADERGERAAGAERRALAAAERELRVALGLLLERDREHPLVLARLHVRRGDDRGGAADRPGGVHPEHRLADRAERVGEVELGLHDAFEEVGRLADHDRVDVGERHLRVVERAEHRLAHEPAVGDVVAARLVVGLTDADDRTRFGAHASPSRMQTRFCCRHGPDVEWASARFPPPNTWFGGVPDAGEPGRHDRVRRERAARRVHRDVVAEAERPAQQDLLVGERGLQLRDLDRTGAEPGGRRPRCGSTASR